MDELDISIHLSYHYSLYYIMQLVIVESPAKTRTISKYLDDDYEVKASVGHIRDLPKSGKNAIDIEGGFIPRYEIVKGKEETIEEIKELSDKSENVILATDPDREGEAIAWHIKETVGLKNPKRIVFHEITREAIQQALQEPRDIDENLRKAQEARRVLDRLIGYGLSGLIWKKIRYGLSAGRVQSPALRIVMEREHEIQDFVPVDYWTIHADLQTGNREALSVTCEKEPTSKEEMEEIISKGKSGNWYIAEVKERESKRAPKAPFTTSTLQQTASSQLGYSPSRTMQTAQKLYEAGHITYMRTDSTQLSSQAKGQIAQAVKNEFGEGDLQPREHKTKSKTAQEAHEAIRPTNPSLKQAGKTEQEKKLYRLIRNRALASQMAPAKLLKTKIIANTQSEEIPNFAANGTRIISEGWLKAEPEARNEENELPKVKEGEALGLEDIYSEEKQTKPPSRYTEAGLVKELEKRGIGRPSTYASIMQTITQRGYVRKEGKTLIPTDRGEVVNNFLENHFPHYVSDSFTAEMENKLDEISEGEAEYEKTLRSYYEPFEQKLKEKKDIPKVTNLGAAPEEYKCPKCGSSMIIKLGKTEKFISCSKFPECQGARTIEGEEIEEDKETGEECPRCGAALIERSGKFGRFVSCSNYPKCKYTKDGDGHGENSTGVKCPQCGKGEMVEKRGKFGPFYACSNYPDCKFTMKSKPTGNTCPDCGSLMMEGTKTIPERCSDKNCPNHNPHKKEQKNS